MESLLGLGFFALIIIFNIHAHLKSKEQNNSQQEKLDAIYAKLSEDEVTVIQDLIIEKNKKEKMIKDMYDTTNNPSYASMPGNVAHQNYLYNNKIK